MCAHVGCLLMHTNTTSWLTRSSSDTSHRVTNTCGCGRPSRNAHSLTNRATSRLRDREVTGCLDGGSLPSKSGRMRQNIVEGDENKGHDSCVLPGAVLILCSCETLAFPLLCTLAAMVNSVSHEPPFRNEEKCIPFFTVFSHCSGQGAEVMDMASSALRRRRANSTTPAALAASTKCGTTRRLISQPQQRHAFGMWQRHDHANRRGGSQAGAPLRAQPIHCKMGHRSRPVVEFRK